MFVIILEHIVSDASVIQTKHMATSSFSSLFHCLLSFQTKYTLIMDNSISITIADNMREESIDENTKIE